ncbi:MAG: glycosyltransferase family 2 protein [Cyanobacteria bacterium P01_D01_bin.56]
MKIHSLCIVKNEEDIIGQVLTAATRWSDYIYVFDNGSNDSTWEQVIELSHQYGQIVPYKKDSCRWSSQLRGQIFNRYRDNFKPGDWCCRLDADEIYIDNPIDFLAKVPSQYQVVGAAMLTYYFSDRDYERYIQNPLSFSDDVPIEAKCRYYRNNASADIPPFQLSQSE